MSSFSTCEFSSHPYLDFIGVKSGRADKCFTGELPGAIFNWKVSLKSFLIDMLFCFESVFQIEAQFVRTIKII